MIGSSDCPPAPYSTEGPINTLGEWSNIMQYCDIWKLLVWRLLFFVWVSSYFQELWWIFVFVRECIGCVFPPLPGRHSGKWLGESGGSPHYHLGVIGWRSQFASEIALPFPGSYRERSSNSAIFSWYSKHEKSLFWGSFADVEFSKSVFQQGCLWNRMKHQWSFSDRTWVGSFLVCEENCTDRVGVISFWRIPENSNPFLASWWFQIYFLKFSPLPGEIIQFDEHIFQMGWFNHQL